MVACEGSIFGENDCIRMKEESLIDFEVENIGLLSNKMLQYIPNCSLQDLLSQV